MPAAPAPEKSSNNSLVFGLQENFHRFWEPPKNNEPRKDTTDGEDELEQVLYAYESVDQEKSLYTVGQNGTGPSVYKRTYTLFPRPGYRQRKCCGCGPKPTLIVILFLLLLILTGVLIYLLARSHEEKAVLVDHDRNEPVLDIEYYPEPPNATEAKVVVQEKSLPTRLYVEPIKLATTRKLTTRTTRIPLVTTKKPEVRNTTLRSLTRPTRSMVQQRPAKVFHLAVPFIPTTTSGPTTTPYRTRRPFPVIFNPCFPFHCHRNALCQTGICRCRAGYEGDGVRVCANINECVRRRGICGCNADCLDNPGSYDCVCRKGYERTAGSTKCRNVDECVVTPGSCPVNSRCVNVSGGHRCVCPRGLKWDLVTSTCEAVVW